MQREGNKENNAIENLMVLTRGEWLTLNNPRLVPKSAHEDCTGARIALARLVHQTHQQKAPEEHHEQRTRT